MSLGAPGEFGEEAVQTAICGVWLVGVSSALADAADGTSPQGAVVGGAAVGLPLVADVFPLEFHLLEEREGGRG